ncbi:MAG: hypothetical protein J6R13_05855 [Alistipes sp.]|nr:hypothetical protein [Alistipes sp.]
MKNTSKEAPAVQNCGNVSTTATTPEKNIILEEWQRKSYHAAMLNLVWLDFDKFLTALPVVMYYLGQIRPDNESLKRAMLDDFAYGLHKAVDLITEIKAVEPLYEEIDELIMDLPYKPEMATTTEK